MIFAKESRKHVSGSSRYQEFQIGAPNLPPPQYVTLSSGAGINEITNCNGHHALINAEGRANLISDSDTAVDTTVVCSSGDDTIEIWSSAVTIKCGTGSEVLRICADTKVLLDVSAGSDYKLEYYNGATANVTVTDGAGNFSVRGTTGEDIFEYTTPDSNLVITAYGGEDLIRVREPLGTAKLSGDDVIIPVGQRGSITVKNGRAHTLNINGHATIVGGHSDGSSPQSVIKTFMSALDSTKLRGIAAVDEAIRKSTKFSETDEAIACMLYDCLRLDDADRFLSCCCNIILDDADTGAITGWDAGTATVKTNESIVDERGTVKTFRGTSFTVNGLKVNVLADLRGVRQDIVNGLYTWWVKDALELIEQSYGSAYRFDAPNASVRELNVEFVDDETSALAVVKTRYNRSNGRATSLTLQINMKYYRELNSHDVNGSTTYNCGNIRASYLDRTLAHEFTHAVMAANIDFFSDLPAWLKEGTAELTHGISDERRADLETLAGNPAKLHAALRHTPDAGEVRIHGVTAPVYAAGFMFLHYLAKKQAWNLNRLSRTCLRPSMVAAPDASKPGRSRRRS